MAGEEKKEAPSAPKPKKQMILTQSIHYRNVYASAFRMSINEDVATIVCANDENMPGGDRMRVEEVRVTMTPKRAKMLHTHLGLMLAEFEATNGEIKLPENYLKTAEASITKAVKATTEDEAAN